jgi:uncharacterized membrane protein HdeD (DUF308 family)
VATSDDRTNDIDRSYWWIGIAAGLINVVLGILLLVWPNRTLALVAWLGGVAIVVWGVRQAMAAFRQEDRFDRTGGLAVAVFTLAFGVAVVVVPEISLSLLRILVGIAAIVWGLADAGRPSMTGRRRGWASLLRGLAGMAFGLALIFWPDPTVAAIAILLGILLLLWGLIEIVASLALRPVEQPSA